MNISALKEKGLNIGGIHKHSRQFVYRAKVKDCKACPVKEKCTKDRSRSLSYHIYEDYLKYAKKQTKTLAYRISQRMRKRIEELFGEAKDYMGLRVAKFRRLWNVKEQFLLTATAQNIKRMAKLLHRADKEIKEAAQEVVTLPDHAIYWLIVTFRSLKMLFRLIICSCYPCELV
jgi:hypothetical protein